MINTRQFRRRPNCVRTLCFDNDHSDGDDTILPAAVTGAVFSSQSSSLVKLRFVATDVGMVGHQFAALTPLTHLTCMEVRTIHTFRIPMLEQHLCAARRPWRLYAVAQYSMPSTACASRIQCMSGYAAVVRAM